MTHQAITKVSVESFRERTGGKKVVLLYPWTSYRNLFLSHFLVTSGDGLLYYRIPQKTSAIENWYNGLINQLNDVTGGFGNTVSNQSPTDMGESLANHLNAYSNNQPIVLFIDELDHVRFDDGFNAFVGALVNGLADNVQVAFSSRKLTRSPWYEMVKAGVAVVLGTERRKDDVIFSLEAADMPQVEIYSFGRGHALVNGQEIRNWDGALPRNLFFYFVDNPLVTRDDIFSTFWYDLPLREATNVFHVTKRKISERVSTYAGEDKEYDLTRYASGFYMPSGDVVRHYDVLDFQEAVDRGSILTDPRETERLYLQAIDLYKAPFLETVDMPWVIERRAHLRRLFAQALIGMGRMCKGRDQAIEALGYFSRAAKEVPEREDVHVEVIKLYGEMDMKNDARRQFSFLERSLREFGQTPSEKTVELYQSIVE